LSIPRWWRGRVAETRDEMDEPFFEFAAEDSLDAEFAEAVGVHRRVETVKAEMRARVEAADGFDQRNCQPRGGVHGHIKRDEISGAKGRFSKFFAREIEADYLSTSAAKPGRR